MTINNEISDNKTAILSLKVLLQPESSYGDLTIHNIRNYLPVHAKIAAFKNITDASDGVV